MIRIMEIILNLLIIKDSMINHLDMKPDKGGNPPKDIRGRKNHEFRVFFEKLNIWFKWKIENFFIIKIKFKLIIK